MLIETNKKIFVIDAVKTQIQVLTESVANCKKTSDRDKEIILKTFYQIVSFIELNDLCDMELKNLIHAFQTGQISEITETDFDKFLINNYINLKP